MKIGIIVATIQEINATKKLFNDVKTEKIYDLEFFEGNIEKNNKKSKDSIVLVKSGIGKVNAGRVAQILIDKFAVDEIINIGAAGAINPILNIKDIVIGSELVQYDYDTSALGETEKGEIDGVGKYLKSDEKLIKKCTDAIDRMKNKDFKYILGRIATADQFCSDKEKANKIREQFNAECVEMEGAAVAQVCKLDNVPFIVIRGISDSPNGNNCIDYKKYCEIAATQVSNLIKEMTI